MSKIKPSLPKGTRDFGPTELRKRQYIFNTIKSVFEKYGFQPIETPVMENLSTLEGKYGEEGDKLLFRILNSGDNLSEIQNSKNEIQTNKELIQKVSEKGLRYDLTIPFARYVVMHQNDIAFPFKRYQIQPVWRADRPQKGRYREFYQCDADVVGSDSLLNEVELVLIYAEAFEKLGVDVTININHRKILTGIATYLGVPNKSKEVINALDKLDKSKKEDVYDSLEAIGISSGNLQLLDMLLESKAEDFKKKEITAPFEYLLDALNSMLIDKQKPEKVDIKKLADEFSEKHNHIKEARKAIIDIEQIFSKIAVFENVKSKINFNITLARGLDYYTGTIFEVKANNVQMGSIGGGGRYDNLTGVFGLQGVSGVGISFGIERIYDVMEELGLFNQLNVEVATTKVMFVNFGGVNELTAFNYVQQIRTENIAAEIYPSNVKMDKQMKYANAKKIPFVAFVGEAELKNNTIQLKNMHTGEQAERSLEEAIELLK